MLAGYSGTPLVQKLGIKPGFRVFIVGAPEGYTELLGDLPDGVLLASATEGPFDFIQAFVRDRIALEAQFPQWRDALAKTGMLWISWPKGSSKLRGDLNDNVVREIGLDNGLVDVKVIAVDQDWSGLKFVYRLKDRD
jgi:hypothetical protein